MSSIRASILVISIVMVSLSWAQPEGDYQWQEVESMNQARSGHASVVFEGEIYVFGGQSIRRGFPFTLNTIEIYDPQSREWRAGPQMPRPLFYHAVVVFGEDIYIFGGRNDRTEIAIFTFSPNRGEHGEYHQVGEMPESRFSASAVVVDDNRILVMGGRSNRLEAFTTGFYYDISDNSISEAPEFQNARANFGLINQHSIIAISGMEFGAVNSIETIVRNEWTAIGRLNTPRGHFGSVVYGDTILLVGGYGNSPMPLNSVDGFTIADRGRIHWGRFLSMNTRRADHSLVILDDEIYAIGGATTRMHITNEVEMYSYVLPVAEYDPTPSTPSLITAWPNPTNGLLTFSFPTGMERIKVINSRGRLLHEQQLTNYSNLWSWNTESIAAGNYYYMVESNIAGKSQIGRFVILK